MKRMPQENAENNVNFYKGHLTQGKVGLRRSFEEKKMITDDVRTKTFTTLKSSALMCGTAQLQEHCLGCNAFKWHRVTEMLFVLNTVPVVHSPNQLCLPSLGSSLMQLTHKAEL